MGPSHPAALVYAAADAPASPGAPVWALATAAVPAAITLVGTLWQANAARRVPPSTRGGIHYAERIWRLERLGPRWPILPRFARRMIVWHVVVAAALMAGWLAWEGSGWWLLPLSVLYGLAAVVYAVLLWRVGAGGSDSTTLRGELDARRPGLAATCLQAVSELGLDVTSYEDGDKSSRLVASGGAATLEIDIEPVASPSDAGPAEPSPENLLRVEITCTPRRGIDGAWRSRRIIDWFATEIIRGTAEAGGDRAESIEDRIDRPRRRARHGAERTTS